MVLSQQVPSLVKKQVYEVQFIYNNKEYLLTFNTEGELVDKKSRTPHTNEPFRAVLEDEDIDLTNSLNN